MSKKTLVKELLRGGEGFIRFFIVIACCALLLGVISLLLFR
ncbi:MAG: hypothetical protein WBA61_08955 [Aequorivita sp.]